LIGSAQARDDYPPPPACDSDVTLSILYHAFDSGQYARRLDLSLREVHNIAEYGDYERSGVRHCTGIGFFNNSQRAIIDYQMVPSGPTNFSLRETTYNFAPPPPGW